MNEERPAKKPAKRKPVPPTDKCNALTRSGELCKRTAGHGTDHLGNGRCKNHGGSVVTASKGNQFARKHGIYSKLFNPQDLEDAAAMAGSVDTELAITRLQLANLLALMAKQGDKLAVVQIEETTIVSGASIVDGVGEGERWDETDKEFDKIKAKRAKTAIQCGEYYDPDDDDMRPEKDSQEESDVLQRKYISKTRDFSTEYTRLTKLIESLERTRASIPHQRAVTEQVKEATRTIAKANNDEGDGTKLTGVRLDSALLEAIKGMAAFLPPIPD